MMRQVVLPKQWADSGTLAHEVLTFVARQRGEVWLVGGAVRDRLLRRETHDLDLVVPTDATNLARQIADHFNGAFHWLDRRRDYGRALLPDVVTSQPLVIDVSRLYDQQLEDDLRARDFTVNAMAVRLNSEGPGELVDPLGGLEDLRQGVLRLASDHALEADPIRLLRAPRLAGELELRIAPEAVQRIRESAGLLTKTSAERIRDELWRMLGQPGCARAARVLHHLELLAIALPEMEALVGLQQSAPHRWDAFEHTVQTMQATDRLLALVTGRVLRPSDRRPLVGLPQDVAESLMGEQLARYAEPLCAHLDRPISSDHSRAGWLRWLALTHDWGKAVTRTVEPDGRVRFLDHDREGARLASERLFALRFSRDEIRHLSQMVRHHMRPLFLTRSAGTSTRDEQSSPYGPQKATGRAVYHFFRDVGDAGLDLLLFGLADHRATYGPDLDQDGWRGQVERTVALLADWFERRTERVAPPSLLDGHTLTEELGIPPGPEVGRLLEAVREAQAAGQVRDRAQALALVRRLCDERD
jgi:tRNA nucleotidyltransferase/poly(A) polymerase